MARKEIEKDQEPTKNDDHSRLGYALISSIRAAVRAANCSEVRIDLGLFKRRVDVALQGRRGFRVRREDDGHVAPHLLARSVNDRVSVVRPRYLVLRVAFALQMSSHALGRYQKSVLWWTRDGTKPACFTADKRLRLVTQTELIGEIL